jgi:hypothetical protein
VEIGICLPNAFDIFDWHCFTASVFTSVSPPHFLETLLLLKNTGISTESQAICLQLSAFFSRLCVSGSPHAADSRHDCGRIGLLLLYQHLF